MSKPTLRVSPILRLPLRQGSWKRSAFEDFRSRARIWLVFTLNLQRAYFFNLNLRIISEKRLLGLVEPLLNLLSSLRRIRSHYSLRNTVYLLLSKQLVTIFLYQVLFSYWLRVLIFNLINILMSKVPPRARKRVILKSTEQMIKFQSVLSFISKILVFFIIYRVDSPMILKYWFCYLRPLGFKL